MYEPLKECLEAVDLPQIVLGLGVLFPLDARKHSFDEMMMERNRQGILGRRDIVFRVTDALVNGLFQNTQRSIQMTRTAWFYSVSNQDPYLGWRGVDWVNLSDADRLLFINMLFTVPEVFANEFRWCK